LPSDEHLACGGSHQHLTRTTGGGEFAFKLVADGHELVDFGDDAVDAATYSGASTKAEFDSLADVVNMLRARLTVYGLTS
jgi:hypothetical protein